MEISKIGIVGAVRALDWIGLPYLASSESVGSLGDFSPPGRHLQENSTVKVVASHLDRTGI